MPPDTVRVVLNVDVPDRAMTAAALYFASPGPSDGPELRAAGELREAAGFAVKGLLIAAGRTTDLYRCQAVPGGGSARKSNEAPPARGNGDGGSPRANTGAAPVQKACSFPAPVGSPRTGLKESAA